MASRTVLVTGADSEFGSEVAFRLAERGLDVIATVKAHPQISRLKQQAAHRGVRLRPEKLDVTVAADRRKAWQWDVDVLLNHVGVADGGSIVDIPGATLRRAFAVNVIGPLLLTQGIAKKMAAQRSGKIIFMSSIAGLMVYPFGGAYAASMHALEAVAEALYRELAEFNVEVATINPGPFLDGFDDRPLDSCQSWGDDPSARLFDYSKLDLPAEQYDPEPVVQTAVAVVTGELDCYRNVVPAMVADELRQQLTAVWDRRVTDGHDEPAGTTQSGYAAGPEPAAS